MADSVGEALGDLAVAALQAEGFTFGTPPVAVSVVKRKVPTLPAGKNPVEIVVVVGEETKTEPMDARNKLETYALAVVVVGAGGHKLRDNATVRSWVQRIKQRIDDKARATFAGLPAGAKLNQVDSVGGKLPFDPAGLAADLDYTVVPFEVQTIEARNTT